MNWQFLFANGSTADWIVLTAFHSLWLSLAGFLIVRIRKFRAPAIQSAWCTFTMILLLLLPFVTWFVPRPVVRAPWSDEASIAASVTTVDVEPPLLNNLLRISTPAPRERFEQWEMWTNLLGLFWLAVSLGCIGRLLFGLTFMERYCDCLRKVEDRRLDAILKEISETYSFRMRPRFFVSLTLPSPVSLGISKPVVVLPAALYQNFGDDELRAVLLHELAHIHHSDHLLGLMQRFVKALYWWNPLVYGVCDTLTTAREEVSDNYAISALGSPESYASLLVALLEKTPQISGLPCVAGMATPYQTFAARIWNIVSKKRDLRVTATKGMLSAISASAILLCALVCLGSQVEFFGGGRASVSDGSRPSAAGMDSGLNQFNLPRSAGAEPILEESRNRKPQSSPGRIDAAKRTDSVTAQVPNGTAWRYMNIGRGGAFPDLRNEGVDVPRTSPVLLGESDTPVVRSRVDLVYPPEAKWARISGIVKVAAMVNEKGEVFEARVLMGHPWFQQAALDAVLQWKYEPLLVDGTPRAFVTTVDFHF